MSGNIITAMAFILICHGLGFGQSLVVKDSKGNNREVNLISSRFGLRLKPYGVQDLTYFKKDYSEGLINTQTYAPMDQKQRKSILYGRLRYFSLHHAEKVTEGISLDQLKRWAKDDIDFELSMINMKRAQSDRIKGAAVLGGITAAVSMIIVNLSFFSVATCTESGRCTMEFPLFPEFTIAGGAGLVLSGVLFLTKFNTLSTTENAGLEAIKEKAKLSNDVTDEISYNPGHRSGYSFSLSLAF